MPALFQSASEAARLDGRASPLDHTPQRAFHKLAVAGRIPGFPARTRTTRRRSRTRHTSPSPRLVGAFRIVGSAVNPTTGGVALITDAASGDRSGFERHGPRAPGKGPFQNLFFDLRLTEKWQFTEED